MKRAKDLQSSAPEAGGGVPGPASDAPESVRREHERYSVELEVNLGSEHNFYAGLAENLSAGGVFVATHRLQKVGSTIDLKLRLPDSDETYDLIGQVRWVRVYNEMSDTPPGLGIRFLELPPRVGVAINKFLDQREPLFFDDD
ncbi:MAG TPA: PilZ domain-containing protein [Polyangiaceae bacterium]|jgi:uncharacterized protein (TIGR02266 family)|nr:PilZ domain-containing protein [Polyangiaceae bacterium]